MLRTTEGPGYRPATSKVRQSIFSMLEARGVQWQGLRVADLFAGSGSLAIEALSRGADFACLVEKSTKAAQLIRSNLETLGVERSRVAVRTADVAQTLRHIPQKAYDVIFIDPPYSKGLLIPALRGVLEHGWLAPEGFVLAEVEISVEPANDPDLPTGLDLITDRVYGQTRIVLWQHSTPAWQSIPERSIP